MSKFLSRLKRQKQTFCVSISEFELFAPGSNKEYEQVNLELQRGKARKILQASLTKAVDTSKPGAPLQRRNTISDTNQRIYFDDQFLQSSQFYMDDKGTGQQKMFVIKVHAHKKNKSGNYLGSHTMLGYCQFDLSKYVNKDKEVVEMDLIKPKIAKSYV